MVQKFHAKSTRRALSGIERASANVTCGGQYHRIVLDWRGSLLFPGHEKGQFASIEAIQNLGQNYDSATCRCHQVHRWWRWLSGETFSRGERFTDWVTKARTAKSKGAYEDEYLRDLTDAFAIAQLPKPLHGAAKAFVDLRSARRRETSPKGNHWTPHHKKLRDQERETHKPKYLDLTRHDRNELVYQSFLRRCKIAPDTHLPYSIRHGLTVAKDLGISLPIHHGGALWALVRSNEAVNIPTPDGGRILLVDLERVSNRRDGKITKPNHRGLFHTGTGKIVTGEEAARLIQSSFNGVE